MTTPALAPPELLPLEEARQMMLDGVEPLAAERVPLTAAHGRVTAEEIRSRLTLPPWDNSAMDGFAVRADDTAAASQERPVQLRVVGESAAGHATDARVESGAAVRILTGAPLPPGADAVVPIEDTDVPAGSASLPESVAVLTPASAGAHVRRAGSDLREGVPLVQAGRLLGPADLAVIAATGHGQVSVHRRPRVAVLATGDELVEPGAALGEAQIPDSNSVGLLAQASEAGADAVTLGIARDRLDDVLARLRPAVAEFDLVVVSGGVSVGAHDVVKAAFEELGTLDLWRVAVQPGKPLAFGRAATALLFGLPGNPVSSHVTFELFVRPVLRRLSGHADLVGRDVVRARLADAVRKDPRRRAFMRVRLEPGARRGDWTARLAGGQGSHVLSALAAADGLAIIPEGVDGLPEGAEVDVLRARPATGEAAD